MFPTMSKHPLDIGFISLHMDLVYRSAQFQMFKRIILLIYPVSTSHITQVPRFVCSSSLIHWPIQLEPVIS